MNHETTETLEILRALELTRDAVATDAAGEAAPVLPSGNRHSPRVRRILAGVPIPERLGGFALVRILGVGGMGAVLEGIHDRTGARVAVKIAPHSRPRQAAALRREVAALARVQAPGIVRVIDTGETDELVWMASELIVGPSLADVIGTRYARDAESTYVSFDTAPESEPSSPPPRERRAAEPRALGWDEIIQSMVWFRDVARTLAALHDVGLIHRDVKPRNILLAEGGVPHLIDLGIAHDMADPDGTRGRIEGTIPFMSPEQTQSGFTSQGPAVDVYSLAVTFHEVLTGRRAVRGGGAAALSKVAFAELPPPSRMAHELPRSLDAIFIRALRKDPAERHGSAREIAAEIDDWLRCARRSRGSTRWLARHRVVLAAALAIGLLAAGIHLDGTVSDRRGVAEIRAELEVGRAAEALALAVERMDRLRDVPGYRDAVELAVARAAPQRTRAMLARQAFTARVMAPDSHDEYGLLARRLLSDLDVRDEHLIFQYAFSLHLDGDRRGALAVLDHFSEITEHSALLSELDALASKSLQRRARLRRALDRLPGLMVTGAPDAATHACLHAYRVVLSRRLDEVELARCRRELEELAPRHALAQSLIIRIDERIDPEAALAGLECLSRTDLSLASWIATRLLLARCAMRLAEHADDPARRDALIEQAAMAGVNAAFARRQSLRWLVRNVTTREFGWKNRSEFMMTVLELYGGEAAFVCEEGVRLCAFLAARHLAAGEHDAVLELGRLVAATRPDDRLPEGAAPSWTAFCERYLEALVFGGENDASRTRNELETLIARERAGGRAAPSLEALAAIAAAATFTGQLGRPSPPGAESRRRVRDDLEAALRDLDALNAPTRNQRRIRVMCLAKLEAVEP